MPVRRPIRLPKQWPAHVKSGVLHAISLASVVLSFARSRATGRRRLQAELEQANTEIALLREELHIMGINAVTFWYALRENGFEGALVGAGRLLREF